MTRYNTSLEIDFGKVGYREGEDFCVILAADNLTQLIDGARKSHRVYELMLISRPGDIWEYVSVVVKTGPSSVLHSVSRYLNDGTADYRGKKAPFELVEAPTQPIPFNKFNSFFYWAYDDTNPADEAWLGHRDSRVMSNYIQQLFDVALSAQNELSYRSPLNQHIASTILDGSHPYHKLSREEAIDAGYPYDRIGSLHSPGFYKKLKTLLREGQISSVAYRGGRDYETLQILATEQRERMIKTGLSARQSLLVSATATNHYDNKNWGSYIQYYHEGMGCGDLWIDEEVDNFDYLIKNNWRESGIGMLSPVDQGDVIGHTKEVGDGWFYYKNTEVFKRRDIFYSFKYYAELRHKFIFDFGNNESIVDHDKTILVVGHSIAADVRNFLAMTVASWQKDGGDILLLIEGEIDSFTQAGCKKVVPITSVSTADTSQESIENLSMKLEALLRNKMPWIDVMLVLDAPDWICEKLSETANTRSYPWPVWVAATEDTQHLNPDHVLSNNLYSALLAARELPEKNRLDLESL